jgi:hypothetical protein
VYQIQRPVDDAFRGGFLAVPHKELVNLVTS